MINDIGHLFIKMAQNTSLIITIAYLLSRTKLFKKAIFNNNTGFEKVILIIIFSLIGIMGDYTGILIKGALANTRVIGPVVASLIGGPLVGIFTGLITAFHRYSIGGFTAFACAVSTLTEALVASLFYLKYSPQKINWKIGLFIGALVETMQMLLILALAKPYTAAWELVMTIGLPMIIFNSLGIAVFIAIVKASMAEEEKAGAVMAQKALQIANLTLPILRKGLNLDSARQVAQIILDQVQVEAVAITDREKILAHVGSGSNHHLPGLPFMTSATKEVLENGELKLAHTKAEIGCDNSLCSLRSAIIVPLRCRDEVLGILKLYQAKENAISSVDVELAQGLAVLFSTQLELALLEEQSKLVAKAELKALQAQINPHFLFNALNTIVSFCRTDSEKARKLLIQLGEFFRKNIQRADKFVSLQEELEHVRAYLSIEQARFGDSLKFIEQVEERAEEWALPALTLQPLVENAIKHGIYPKVDGGTVKIYCRVENDVLQIIIEDDGVGIAKERLKEIWLNKHSSLTGAGLGIGNVNERLKHLYGQDYGLKIESTKNIGTTVSLRIPA